MCWMCDHPGSTVDEWLDVIHDVKVKNGWAVQYVEDDRAPYAYTIGLLDRGLPELLVTGVSPPRAARMMNRFAEYVVDHGPPAPGEQITLPGGPPIEAVEVEHPDAHMYVAVAFYGSKLRALQLVWADGRGRWPWTAAFCDGRAKQPVLGVRANAH